MGERYKKLVRDKIPEIILAHGETPITRTLDEHEFDVALQDKAYEELAEFFDNPSAEEAGDFRTVFDLILKRVGITGHEIAVAQQQKLESNGGFENKIYLEGVE